MILGQENSIREIAALLVRDGAGPVYLQIAHHLRAKILQGELIPGALLPKQQRLAELLGVGQVTVRRALRELAGQGLVRSRQGSGTLVCNGSFGRAPRPGAAQPVSIVFTDSGDGYPFLYPIVEAVRRAARTPPRLVHLDVNEDNISLIEQRVQWHATGGLILNSPVNLTLVTACARLSVPYVLLFNELIDGVSRCLTVDYGPGLAEAIEHLRSRGRRRIVLMTPQPDRFSAERWSQTFVVLMRAYGLSVHAASVIPAGYHQLQGYTAAMALLEADDPPDAILCSSDYQALGALRAAQDRGVRVPDALSVIGSGPLAGESDWPAALSTIDLHLDVMARHALEALQPSRGQTPQPLRRSVSSTFVRGATS